jgi:hypothetical protein
VSLEGGEGGEGGESAEGRHDLGGSDDRMIWSCVPRPIPPATLGDIIAEREEARDVR